MMIRYLYLVILCLVSFLPSCMSGQSNSKKETKPNIIFILADDMSYYDLSCLGQKEFTTPNIDKLYNKGLFFSQAYSGSPECAPSRSTFMEGKHLGRNRIRHNSSVRGQDHLLSSDVTVAEILKKAGYKTGFVGKWGIGLPGTEGTPDRHGFDYAYGFYDQARAHTFYPHYLWENDKQVAIPENYGFDMEKAYAHRNTKEGTNVYDESGQLIPNGIENPLEAKNSQDLIHDKALKFIQENKDEPMFLYYATQLPHGPVITPNLGDYKDKPWEIKQKEWAAMMTHLDTHVGELVKLTEELGIADNTIFIFASDNGYSQWGYMGRGRWVDDPLFKHKGPWKGGKFGSFDGGMRIPMLAYCPGIVPHGTTDHLVVLYDFMATASDLAGIEAPDNDGISFAPLLTGESEQQEEHPWLYWGGGTHMPQAQAVRMGSWFGMREKYDEPIQLWDLSTDLSCENNIAADHPEIVGEIIKIINQEHNDSEWFQNPGETIEEIEAKKQKAIDMNIMQNNVRANSIYPEIVK